MTRKRRLIHLALLIATAYSTAIAGAMFEQYGFTFAAFLHLLLHPSALIAGIPFSFWILFILGSHEMGHYLACRRYGVPATLPYFIPGPTIFGTFGAVIRIKGIIPDRNALFDIGAAGPIAGFLATIPALFLGLSRATVSNVPLETGDLIFGNSLLIVFLEKLIIPQNGSDVVVQVNSVFYAGWAGLLATTMNLFPVGQLDGGHLCYAISRKFHRLFSLLTILAMAALVMYSFYDRGFSVWLLWLVILIVMGPRHPRLLYEEQSLSSGRKIFALLLFLILALSFMPDPLYIY